MKKALVGTVLCLLAVAVPAQAGDGNFKLTLDAWAADTGGTMIQGAQDTTCPGPGNCGNVPQIVYGVDDGTIPSLNFAWTNGNTGNGFSLSYYSLDEEGDRVTSLTDDANTFSRIHFNNGFSNHGDWWEGTAELEMTNITVAWTHQLNSSDSGSWNIAFGLTSANYDADDTQFMNNQHNFGTPLLETVREYQVDIQNEFSGFGPSIAVSGTQNLGDSGLQFIGSASLAFVTGDHDYAYNSQEDPFDLTNTLHPTSGVAGDIDGDSSQDVFFTMQQDVVFSGSVEANAFIADILLGLNYDFDFGLSLRAGWRTSLWNNVADLQVGSPLTDQLENRDASISGVFVGAGWTF